jgi:penicillin-binding protein 1C
LTAGRRLLLLAAALSMTASAVFAALCWSRATLEAPPASFMLYDRHGQFLAQIGGGDADGYGYWPAPPASERMVQALLALEDRRFWRHPGVDPAAVARAALQDLAAGRRVSGASSIAMQVARLQTPAPRTLLNKALEAGTALCLTLRYGREAVLEQYLRLVPFGNNSHGIAHAARFYFDKPVADLSWAEIALLAAVPQAPSRLNPLSYDGHRRAVARGRRLLADLWRAGVVGDDDFRLADRQIALVPLADRPRRASDAMHVVLRLERLLGGAEAWLQRHQEARVMATLDLDLQHQVEDLAAARLLQWRAGGAEQLAVAVIDRASREVLAWVGSADYFGPDAGAIDFGDAPRSPGSTLKPFLYALGLDRGVIRADMTLRDDIDVAPGIENADRRYLGRLLPRQALANSRNAPAAALVRATGIDETYQYLRSLGLHESADPAEHYGLGLAIGALPTSLERLVRAYGALANDGVLAELGWYRGEDRPMAQRVMSVAAARQVSLFLADPLARLPSFPRMGPAEFPFPVAVKTGTSQDYRDAWALAYSPLFIVGVWVGRADAAPMQSLGGMGSAAELAHDVLLALHQDPRRRLEDLSFPKPEAHRAIDVCSGSGCPALFREWVPEEAIEQADSLLIDRRTGLLATQATAPEDIREEPIPTAGDRRGATLASNPMAAVEAAGVVVISPPADGHFLSDPDLPEETQTIALRAAVSGPFRDVQWYVDDHLYGTAGDSAPLRWRLEPGVHTFQAKLAGRPECSAVVSVTVD